MSTESVSYSIEVAPLHKGATTVPTELTSSGEDQKGASVTYQIGGVSNTKSVGEMGTQKGRVDPLKYDPRDPRSRTEVLKRCPIGQG